MTTDSPSSFRAALGEALTQDGRSLLTLSERVPTLVVFLRHFG